MIIDDVEDYIAAAKRHGEDDHPDHEVGDLQDALRICFAALTKAQKARVLKKLDRMVGEMCLMDDEGRPVGRDDSEDEDEDEDDLEEEDDDEAEGDA